MLVGTLSPVAPAQSPDMGLRKHVCTSCVYSGEVDGRTCTVTCKDEAATMIENKATWTLDALTCTRNSYT